MTGLKSASRKYVRQTLKIVFGLFLLELLVCQLLDVGLLLTPIMVSMFFALAVDIADACVWPKIEGKADETKATFFMAVSGFRFLLALLLLFVYYLVSDRDGMVAFLLSFAPFYLTVLLHHSLFFSRLRNTAGHLDK